MELVRSFKRWKRSEAGRNGWPRPAHVEAEASREVVGHALIVDHPVHVVACLLVRGLGFVHGHGDVAEGPEHPSPEEPSD